MQEKYVIDEYFDDTLSQMKCDIYMKDNNYYIDIDAPGYDKTNLLVEYSSGYISVTLNRKQSEDQLKKYLKKERNYGIYKRQFYVGDIDVSKIIAKYKDGVLSLIVPKAKNAVSKIINIK